MKLLKIKLSLTLDEKEQAQRQAALEKAAQWGLPADLIDPTIYRIGLEAAERETKLSPENNSQDKAQTK